MIIMLEYGMTYNAMTAIANSIRDTNYDLMSSARQVTATTFTTISINAIRDIDVWANFVARINHIPYGRYN